MSFWHSLSGRLVAMTILFVMIAEVLIFVPSLARFREQYLLERVAKGALASGVLIAMRAIQDDGVGAPPQLGRAAGSSPQTEGVAAPDAGLAAFENSISDAMRTEQAIIEQLLIDADVYEVAFLYPYKRELMMARPYDGVVAGPYDLTDAGIFVLIRDAFVCLFWESPQYISVIGPSRDGEIDRVFVVVDDQQLKTAMIGFAERIFWLSLAISGVTAVLMLVSVNFFVVRPMRRVIDGVISFREEPENPDRIIRPSGARGEIGQAEIELAETQKEVRAALQQRARLAALGAAVAKISHDLRNILASTQLLADRLESSKDPLVTRIAPKLIRSIDRGIRICRDALAYGQAKEPPPNKQPVALAEMVDEVAVALGLDSAKSEPVRFVNAAPKDLYVTADPDQLFRSLLNLARNALQAMEARGDRPNGAEDVICVEARAEGGSVAIDVVDTGPGVPEKAQAALFQPFKGSTSRGGSGLGLSIAHELVSGHGGRLELVESGATGARFRLTLPGGSDAQAADQAAATRAAQ